MFSKAQTLLCLELLVSYIFSVVGHSQYANNPSGHFYSATKFAVSALTEGLKNELTGTHIRVTVSEIPVFSFFVLEDVLLFMVLASLAEI